MDSTTGHKGQAWLSLCLQEEERWFLKRGVWERQTEAEVLFAVEEVLGKPSSWPPYQSKLFFKKHLGHCGMLNLFNFLLCNGMPLHIMHQWRKVRACAVQFDGPRAVVILKSWFKGTCAHSHFTCDLIEGCYCFLEGQRCMVPKHLRSKQESI